MAAETDEDVEAGDDVDVLAGDPVLTFLVETASLAGGIEVSLLVNGMTVSGRLIDELTYIQRLVDNLQRAQDATRTPATGRQDLAATASLPGTYRAWLSDDAQSPSTRFSQSTGPYQLLNGATVATSWADLTDGTLATPITLAENGATFDDLGLRAWTNTLANGTGGGVLNENCAGWTTGANGSDGDEGQVAATNDNWTDFASGTCNNLFHLYCFQQS